MTGQSNYSKLTKRQPKPRRTREERELQRLRDILEPRRPPLWTAWQATWRLVGIEPDSSELTPSGSQPPDYQWLPGGAAKFNTDPWIRYDQVERAHEYVAAFCTGDSRTPREWIKHSIAKEHVPPWLEAACKDPECRQRLPSRIVKKYGPKTPGETPQSKGGFAKRDSDRKSSAIARRKGPFLDALKACPKNPDGTPVRGWMAAEARKIVIELTASNIDVSEQSLQNRLGQWKDEYLAR